MGRDEHSLVPKERPLAEREHLEQAITALESQRATLGDAVVEASVAALRQQLATLDPPPADQQRKLVTLLLADVSGFTALSETMDAEDVTDLMNALWRRLDAVILEHGGRIDKHMGDAVMALWGTEVAQEDDPVRAVRAALAMQEQVQSFAAARGATPLLMRIGVHTGLVLLGAVGTTGEFTAIGDAVNAASRLQYAAPVGGVLVSHDTYRHARGFFEVQPLEPISIRGKTELLQVYVVLRARPRAFRLSTRGVEGIETRMVGREVELRFLQHHFEQALLKGAGRWVAIIGEAGVGKSRLLYEFERWLEFLPQRSTCLKGRASAEMQSLPYALLRELLASNLGIQDSDSAATAREKWERGLARVWGANDQSRAHILGQLVGFDFRASPHLQGVLEDAQQLRDRGLLYLADYARSMSAAAPVVALLEDLHWADDSSLDAIEYIIQAATAGADQAAPLMILATTRPALFERRPIRGALHLSLQPLSPADTEQLARRYDLLPG